MNKARSVLNRITDILPHEQGLDSRNGRTEYGITWDKTRYRYQFRDGSAIIVEQENDDFKKDITVSEGIHYANIGILSTKCDPFDKARLPFVYVHELSDLLYKAGNRINHLYDWQEPVTNPIFSKIPNRWFTDQPETPKGEHK